MNEHRSNDVAIGICTLMAARGMRKGFSKTVGNLNSLLIIRVTAQLSLLGWGGVGVGGALTETLSVPEASFLPFPKPCWLPHPVSS